MQKPLLPSLLLGTLLLAGCAKTPATTPVVGTESTEGGFQDESPDELVEKIKAGDRDAAFRLGAMYHDGQGVRQDYTKALQLFEGAGRVGDGRSQYNAGMMYLRGEGTDIDYVAARRWFTLAAEGGNVRAPYQLGLLSYQGLGTPQDFAKALEGFTQSAQKGMPEAQYNLGIMYIRGEGVKQDPMEGYVWLLVARTYGHSKAIESIEKLEKSLTAEQKKEGQTKAQQRSDSIEANKAVERAKGEAAGQ